VGERLVTSVSRGVLFAAMVALATGLGLAEAGATPFRLTARAAGGLSDLPPLRARAVPVASAADAGAAPVEQSLAGGVGELALGGSGPWTVSVEGEGVWAAPLDVASQDLGGGAIVEVYPSSALRASFDRAAAGRLPDQITVQLWWQGAEERETALTRPAVVDGAFSIAVPATLLDVRVAIPGKVPVYRWGVEAKPGSSVNLGTLPLTQGGSVAGFVVDGATGLPLPGAEVLVDTRAGGPPPSVADLERRSALARQATTDAHGFFQVLGVEAGRYRVSVTARDRAPTLLEGIGVDRDAETLLDRVEVLPPATVTVLVIPGLDPLGGRWRVTLVPHDVDGPAQPARVECDSAGRCVLIGVAPGPYRILIVDSIGSRFGLVERLVRGDLTEEVDLDLVRVEGDVTLRGDPVVASVRLSGGEGQEVTLVSDEEGRLSGWVTRPEQPRLDLRVTCDKPGIVRRMRDVEVDLGDEVLRLSLELGGVTVHGTVVDHTGMKVEAAKVRLAGVDERVFHECRSEPDGSFVVEGVEEGRYLLTASHRTAGVSDDEELDTRDFASAEITGVVVTLKPSRSLSGRVVYGGGVPGAKVVLADQCQTVTDVEGRFRCEVPAAPRAAVATVKAPSAVLWSGAVALDGEEVVITLPTGAPGTLVVADNSRTRPAPALALPYLLTSDGGFLTVGELQSWRATVLGAFVPDAVHDDGSYLMTVPAVAPGAYAVAWLVADPMGLHLALPASGPPTGLEWQALPPGGTLALTLPPWGQ
jgi:hypothetical protein